MTIDEYDDMWNKQKEKLEKELEKLFDKRKTKTEEEKGEKKWDDANKKYAPYEEQDNAQYVQNAKVPATM